MSIVITAVDNVKILCYTYKKELLEEGMDVFLQPEVEEFKKLSSDFCKKSLIHFIDEKHPDGNFEIMDKLYQEACSIGIVALSNPQSTGYDYGVWGNQTLSSTSALSSSLAILETLAQTSATFAYRIHMQGLATKVLCTASISSDVSSTLVSLYTSLFPPSLSALHNPCLYTSGCKLLSTQNTTSLIGEIPLSYGYNPQSVLLVVPHQSTWAAVHCTMSSAMGITPVRTLGLRGLAHSISFNNLQVDTIALLDEGTMRILYSFLFLGIVAIAIGIAQSAYTRAYAYANERYQRGGLIKTIESVQGLLAKSQATITTIRYALYQARLSDSYRLLNFAAQLKFMAGTKLPVAVSDCLQVFGGYGYMEDFGIEKKYRDIHTLATIAGSPIFMKQFIAQLSMEE